MFYIVVSSLRLQQLCEPRSIKVMPQSSDLAIPSADSDILTLKPLSTRSIVYQLPIL